MRFVAAWVARLICLSVFSPLVYGDGKSDYDTKCAACHGFGVAGAPRLEDYDSWKLRLQKGLENVQNNAINGFQGEVGYMPAKGGFTELTDDQVRAAVDYMLRWALAAD
ncbi:MAG: c-type cytochrome [Pseudomonadota bacterium]